MIKTLEELKRALKPSGGKKPLFAGVILWQGASLLDGAPIVVIATKILGKSRNGKTGHTVQSYILRSDVNPVAALKTGEDASICGGCPHRPILAKETGEVPCYVRVFQSVGSVFRAFKDGRYAIPGVDYDVSLIPALFEGLVFRAGTYGDPCAAPYQIWRAATLKAKAITGYTHQWRDVRFSAFKLLFMASADSALEGELARAMGWRTFRVRYDSDALERGVEIACPASAEAGKKTTCADCKACGGMSAKAKVSIAIIAHGLGSSAAIKAHSMV